MISIIIPTYCPTSDVRDKLRRCIKAIVACTDMSAVELVIVEQGDPIALTNSPDLGGARLVYMYEEKPIGFARAVNRGVALSHGQHLLIVNNDIVVSPGWAHKLVAKYQATRDAGMLAPACTRPEDAIDVIEHPVSWWSCVCISRAVWDAVGPLDEEKLNYRLHDQSWSIEAYNRGLVVGIYRGVTVEHESCSTYRHMDVDERPERAEMVRRWGFEHFADYVKAHPRFPR